MDVAQPVSLLILDINMPRVSGLECIKQVRKLYGGLQLERQQEVLRPFVVYMTETPQNIILQFVQEQEKPDLYLEKPVPRSAFL